MVKTTLFPFEFITRRRGRQIVISTTKEATVRAHFESRNKLL